MNKVFFLLIFIVVVSCQGESSRSYEQLQGYALGTTFHITMDDRDNKIQGKDIDSLIHLMNRSLSTYLPNSDISRINKGDTTVRVDAFFLEVFDKSIRIFEETDGSFDPTIGILVNAWGFGPDKPVNQMDQHTVDSLMVYVGFDQISLKDGKVIKEHPESFLDFNANAKGFTVDVIGRYLEKRGIRNYLVEIGGEVRARGKNMKGLAWKIAIEQPNFDGSRSFQTIVSLQNESIATSGNYRKFKIDSLSGEKFAHTIDPHTGYPTKSYLLSASVIGSIDCADADGYATALMAMGLDRSLKFLESHEELKSFLIFGDDKGSLQTFATPNLTLQDD